MTSREITEELLRLEESLRLFDVKVGGIFIWERVRFLVQQRILTNTGLIEDPFFGIEPTLTKKIKKLGRSLRNIVFSNPCEGSQKDLLFYGHGRRRLHEDGNWWDVCCDPIVDRLNCSHLFIESYYYDAHLVPTKTDDIRYLDRLEFLGALGEGFGLIAPSLDAGDRETIIEIERELSDTFQVDPGLLKITEGMLMFHRRRLTLYETMLKRIAPKLVILVVSYGKETFIEACKNKGVPVVELQHGSLSQYHLGYSFPGAARRKHTFPDFFFAFGDFWKNCIEFPIDSNRVFSMGYPYLEMHREKYRSTPKKKQILFISQAAIGQYLSRFAVESCKSRSLKHRVIYKLHPHEYRCWRKDYPWLEDSGIEVIEDDNTPLYRLLAESEVLAGVHSTAILEGLSFGARVILWDLPGVENMDQMIDRQNVKLISSVEELISSLENPDEKADFPIDEFFRNNSIRRIRNMVDEIVAGNRDR